MESWNSIRYRNEGNKYKNIWKKEIKEKIIEIVRKNDLGGGSSEKQLAIEINKDPKNLRKYLKELVKEELIFKKNKLSPYFSTDKSYQDPFLKNSIFGKKISENIKKYTQRESLILTDKKQTNNSNKICTIPDSLKYNNSHSFYHDFCILFERYKFFYQPKFTAEYKLEAFLFEFSNIVGGVISYFLIKTLTADNNNNKQTHNQQNNKLQNYNFKITLELFSNIIPILYETFREYIDKIEGKYPTFREFEEMNKEKVKTLKNLSLKTSKTEQDKIIIEEITNDYHNYKIAYFKNRSNRINNKDTLEKLENSFFNIYPLLYHELRKIDINLDNEISKYKEFIKNIHIKSELQQKCKHEYGFPTLDLFGNYVRICKNKIKYKKTEDYEICGYRKIIDKSIGKPLIKMYNLLNSNEDNYIITNVKENKKLQKDKKNVKVSSVKVRIENDKGNKVENIIFFKEGIAICNEYIRQLPDSRKEI